MASWEHGIEWISRPSYSLLDIDFETNVRDLPQQSVSLQLEKSGLCHGVAFWIDYYSTGRSSSLERDKAHPFSTGPNFASPDAPTPWLQGFLIFEEPREVIAEVSVAQVTVVFLASEGRIKKQLHWIV